MRKLVYVFSLLLFSLGAMAQKISITGKVTNAKGEPLAGASLTEKGTTNSTTTKAEGNFALSVASDKSVVSVTYVGYETEEVMVGNTAILNIQLVQAPRALNAVVVTGYSSQRKVDLTGAVSVVNLAEV